MDQRDKIGTIRSGGSASTGSSANRSFWRRTEVLLLVIGATLLIFFGVSRLESRLALHAALTQFAMTKSEATANVPDRSKSRSEQGTARPAAALPGDTGTTGSAKEPVQPTHRAEAFGAPLAILRISRINLEVPVLNGTDNLTLNGGVGRISGTAWPGDEGNMGIAGHRDSFFRGLKDVRVGDSIEVETRNASETYTIDKIQIVSPSDVAVLQPRGIRSLTLVTCYPFYYVGSAPRRYVVRASLNREITSGPEESLPARN